MHTKLQMSFGFTLIVLDLLSCASSSNRISRKSQTLQKLDIASSKKYSAPLRTK